MEYEKAIPFKNWTLTDFKGIFGGVYYDFRRGATYSVPSGQALHFAKQLAVRELHEVGYRAAGINIGGDRTRGEMLTDMDVEEYIAKCFPSIKPGDPETTSGSFDRIDEVKDVDAKEAAHPQTDNTATDREPEEDEENADDEKNNAGAPTFKKPIGRPRKDAEYTK